MECWHTFLFVKTFLFYRIESTPINIISDVKKKWSLWSKDTSLDCYLSVCFLSSCTHVCYILTKKKKNPSSHILPCMPGSKWGKEVMGIWPDEEEPYCFIVEKLAWVLMVWVPVVVPLEISVFLVSVEHSSGTLIHLYSEFNT